jgi:hypothetical protein
MKQLTEIGIWIVQHPGQAVACAIGIWALASVLAFAWLCRTAQKETAPKASGWPSRKVSR